MRLERAVLFRYGLPTLFIGVCAALLGWSSGETSLPPLPPIAETPWNLSAPNGGDPARDLAELLERKPWSPGILGPGGAAGAQAAAPQTWRLAGVVQRDDGTFALVAVGTGPTAKLDYLRVGDPLPDGSILIAITADSAVVKSRSGTQRVYKLFDKKS